MNTLELSNVEISANLQEQLTERKNRGDFHEVYIHKVIDPVIQRLATLNPLWRFVATDWGYGGNNRLALTSFSVLEHGEEMGKISREHHGRNEVIHIANERIAKTRERTTGYSTVDADKAVLKAKKMFFKLKPNERVEKALKDAESVIGKQKRLKEREQYTADGVVKNAAHGFIMGTGFHLFLAHIKTCAESERNKIENAMQEKLRLDDEMMTIEKAKAAFEANKTALVIKDGGKYLVKIGDKVDMFDDNTLPDWMRSKLGMLKLVAAEQFVSDTGCRVNDETFVLMVEE
jgi:tetrahydromethanopterin S-methyltransferase subunit B